LISRELCPASHLTWHCGQKRGKTESTHQFVFFTPK
jgi:hypothetical protein